ncbi:MAG: DUF4262 domain-containing protein [Gemmatimonadota bacterium]
MTNADVALRDLVERHGWAVVKISEDERGPGFAYTVGLSRSFGHPEVLISGLDLVVLQEILNEIGAKIRDGATFSAGHGSDDVLEGYPVTFREIAPAAFGTYLGAGVRFYGDMTFAALHCIWPDKAGRFPWDAGVVEWVRWAQPALSDGPEATTFDRPAS